MSCTSPIKAWLRRKDRTMCFHEPRRGDSFLYKAMEVPCHRCLDCRLEYAADWSMRIMHEAQMHKRNCVATLTYDDEHLPPRADLRERDVQLFFKRLRKRYAEESIAYAYCAEYGDEGGRPHYHVILFGHDFDDKSYWKKSASGSKLWKSKECEQLWGCGQILLGEVTKETADYVGRYAVKKVTGQRAKEHYRRLDPMTGEEYFLTPEFFRVSKGRAQPGESLPFGRGVGARWLERFFSDVFPGDQVVFRGGRSRKPPRYYLKLLKRRDSETFDAIKAKREVEAQDPKRLAEQTPERRSVRDQISKAKLSMKRRQL